MLQPRSPEIPNLPVETYALSFALSNSVKLQNVSALVVRDYGKESEATEIIPISKNSAGTEEVATESTEGQNLVIVNQEVSFRSYFPDAVYIPFEQFDYREEPSAVRLNMSFLQSRGSASLLLSETETYTTDVVTVKNRNNGEVLVEAKANLFEFLIYSWTNRSAFNFGSNTLDITAQNPGEMNARWSLSLTLQDFNTLGVVGLGFIGAEQAQRHQGYEGWLNPTTNQTVQSPETKSKLTTGLWNMIY